MENKKRKNIRLVKKIINHYIGTFFDFLIFFIPRVGKNKS